MDFPYKFTYKPIPINTIYYRLPNRLLVFLVKMSLRYPFIVDILCLTQFRIQIIHDNVYVADGSITNTRCEKLWVEAVNTMVVLFSIFLNCMFGQCIASGIGCSLWLTVNSLIRFLTNGLVETFWCHQMLQKSEAPHWTGFAFVFHCCADAYTLSLSRLLQEFVEKNKNDFEAVYTIAGWLKKTPPTYHIRLVPQPKLAG